jgi:two-component system, NarL family, nitrate/nitrite response regulator NarL
VELAGCTGDSLTALNLNRLLKPEVLVLDPTVAKQIRNLDGFVQHHPRVLVLTPRRHLGVDAPCATGCACGVIRDAAPIERISTLLQVLINCGSPKVGLGRCEECPARNSVALPQLPLSEREYEVFVKIGRGWGASAIAESLALSVKTVETHRENIKRKLGLDSAHALLLAAIRWNAGDFVMQDDDTVA